MVGLPSHFVEAERWLTKAADQGFAPAQMKLANWYLTGRGFREKDYVKARHWYKQTSISSDWMSACSQNTTFETFLGGMDSNGSLSYSRFIGRDWWNVVLRPFLLPTWSAMVDVPR